MTTYFFLIGSCLGSFLGVVLDRFPQSSLFFPRSHCFHCHHSLCFWDMIPILSQWILGSRCRYCGTRLPMRYWLLELVAGLCVAGAYLGILSWPHAILILLSHLLTLYDLRDRSYPVMVWIVGNLLLLAWCPLHLPFWLWIGLGGALVYIGLPIGWGDFLLLASFSLVLPLYPMLVLLHVASLAGILYLLLARKKLQFHLPFIPFLYGSFLLILLFF